MDPTFRAKQESVITSRLTKVFSDQRKRLASGGRAAGWEQFTKDFEDAIAEKLQQTYENSAMLALLLMVAASPLATDSLKERPITFDGGPYATKRAKQLARELKDRVKSDMEQLQRGRKADIKQAEEDGVKPPSSTLKPTDLAGVLGPANAEAIAVTETTAADISGVMDSRDATTKRFEVDIKLLWRTERDGKVCPICAPNDGRDESFWGRKFPNGPRDTHPRCRCELEAVTYWSDGAMTVEPFNSR